MSTHSKWLTLFLVPFIGIVFTANSALQAANGITLFTPYTNISVPPGQSITYTVSVINNTSAVQTISLSVSGMPKGWDYTLQSGGWNIGKISLLPGGKENLIFKVEVPLKVNKGHYRFRLLAGGIASLPLEVEVSEKGTYETEFTTDQPNMEGNSGSTFTYKAKLRNRTADEQLYALRADAPPGWNVTFKVSYKQVTSVNIKDNASKDITIQIKPPEQIKAGKYKIPVEASTNSTSASVDLESVVTGTYSMELTTPTGLLSTDMTAGDTKKIDMIVRNTGSSSLKNIGFSAAAPTNWSVTFEPKKVIQLGPGSITHVTASVKADGKAIPGDYVTKFTARTPETSSKTSFRITVKTPMLWGWIGVLIILLAVGIVYYLFRKYGRR
ncbi:MAG TPA: NEW3 domain-containing protein [Bacteroidales bacterium]|nr:NEW3 domain-containing protein [Bacteroidales bacterium]